MLEIRIPSKEIFNEETESFEYTKEQVLKLEHSLISLSKWEAKWGKPFLNSEEKTSEEILDYIKCMIIGNTDPEVVYLLDSNHFSTINEYISNPMTATTINEKHLKKRSTNEIMTSELFYCYMFQLGIPIECEKWHLNRLQMLIRVCSIKSSGGTKMSKRDIMSQNAALNKARRAAHGTKG